MAIGSWLRRLRSWVSAASRYLRSLLGLGDTPNPDPDGHTAVTFRAVADAVVPRTPELGDELGPEHVPGGLEVALDDFLVTYVDDLFQFGFPHIGTRGNLPLATPLALVLDVAALTLHDRGETDSEPSDDRARALCASTDAPAELAAAAGPFAKLSRRDRLRTIAALDEFEIEVSPFGHGLFELDAGLVGQLAVGFTEMIYYSEWQGYDDYGRPPSERVHPNDPAAVQSWRQTDYPGFADGYASLRGYLGSDAGPLGDGETWATIDDDAANPVRIRLGSGTFRENDYDTSGYEEPYPEVE